MSKTKVADVRREVQSVAAQVAAWASVATPQRGAPAGLRSDSDESEA